MNDNHSCPHCGSQVFNVLTKIHGATEMRFSCPRCGPVAPVQTMTKVLDGGGPLLKEQLCRPG